MVSIQLLHVGKVGLPSFFSPMFCRIESSCFHLKAQLKHPPSPRKERRWRWRKYTSSNCPVWTLAGVSTGAEPEETKSCPGQRETQTTQGNSALYCWSGKDASQDPGAGSCVVFSYSEGEKRKQESVQAGLKFHHWKQKDILTEIHNSTLLNTYASSLNGMSQSVTST